MAVPAELGRLLADVELSCSCCLQYFTEPVRLASCSHSFCRSCIDTYCRGRRRAPCPLCREDFEPKDLRPNRELAALVSLMLGGGRGEGLGAWDQPTASGDGAGGGCSSAWRRPGEKVGEGAAGASPHPGYQFGKGAVAQAEITSSCFLLHSASPPTPPVLSISRVVVTTRCHIGVVRTVPFTRADGFC